MSPPPLLPLGRAPGPDRPGRIAHVFAVNGAAALPDGLICRKAGAPCMKHLVPAALGAVVAIWALTYINNTGAA